MIILLALVSMQTAFTEDELPLGIYFQTGTVLESDSHKAWMKDSLGMNFVNPTFCDSDSLRIRVGDYNDYGLKSVLIVPDQDYNRYSSTNYFVVQAEDTHKEARFKYHYSGLGSDFDPSGWYHVSDQVGGTILDSLSFRAYRQYELSGQYGGDYIQYVPSLYMKIDTLEVARGAVVSTLKVFAGVWWGNQYSDLYADSMVFPIYSTPFFDQNPRMYDFGEDFFTWNPEIAGHFGSNHDFLTFRIESADTCDLWFDYLKVFDDLGHRLIDEGEFDDDILAYVSPSNWAGSSVTAWFLNDEPLFSSFLPCRYIDSLLVANECAPAVVNNWSTGYSTSTR